MPLRNSLPERHTLRTRSYWIRRILNVSTIDILAIFREYRGPDAEFGVRAVGCGFRSEAAGVQGVKLGCGYGIDLAGLGNVGFVI